MRMSELVKKLQLRPLSELSAKEQQKIRSIRNQPEVRRNMFTDHEISEAEHVAWLDRMKARNDTRFFGVFFEDELIGAVGLNNIDIMNKRAEWAFYLDESTQGKGLGSALEFIFLDYAFEEQKLKKLNCEVIDFNKSVIKLHKKFGFVQEGVRRQHIERDGEARDVVLLGITDREWEEKRSELIKGIFR